MASKKYTDITAGTVTTADVILVADAATGTLKKVTVASLLSAAGGTLASPGGFTAAAASSSQINLSWSAVTSATAYVVDWSPNGSTGWTNIYGGSGTSYSHTGLTGSTTYYYRIQATASGFTSSTYSTANATTSAGTSYLTWFSLGTNMEQYNTNKGMRKKVSTTDEWTNSTSVSWAVETLTTGHRLIAKVGSDATKATVISLDTSRSSTHTYGDSPSTFQYAIAAAYNLTANAQYKTVGNTDTGTTAIATGNLLALYYSGSSILYQKSTDGGSSWTTLATATTGASGSYYIAVNSYSNGYGFDELYIV